MDLLDRIAAELAPAERDNDTSAISIYDWARMFRPGGQVVYNGNAYTSWQTMGGGPGGALYDTNSIVFACEAKRILVFSEARFQFQRFSSGRPGEMFGTPDLTRLEQPWLGHWTRDLLARAELDIFSAGNSYWIPDGPYLLRLDPARVKILTEAAVDPMTGFRVGERLLGYAVINERREVTIYDPTEIAHYKPYPHKDNQFLGVSWLNACLPDVDADQQMTEHKRVQLRNGANLGYVVSLDKDIESEQFDEFVEKFREWHEGPENAGKTVFVGGGADIKTVGQTFENLALKATQGATETRIAACAGVHPVVVGLSEGLGGSALNAGNYSSAKRSFVDGTMRPHWGAFCAAFGSIVPPPSGSRLWYDDRDIPFLREDVTDQADILVKNATVIRTLLDAGFNADAVVQAALTGDLGRLLGQHSNLFSVQLQPAGAPTPASEAS